jgi:hypothetical protein
VDPADKIDESRVGPYRIEARVNHEIHQLVRTLLIGLAEPFERLVVLAKADMDQRELVRIDVFPEIA